MVTKEIIYNIIDECTYKQYQVKCSQRLTVSDTVKKAFQVCREETCNPLKPRKSEKAYFIDEKGKIVFTKVGTKSGVSWDKSELREVYEEFGELHIEHNHPLYQVKQLPVFLSSDDVNMIAKSYGELSGGVVDDGQYVYKSITCEGANGTRMAIVRGDNFNVTDKRNVSSLAMKYEREVTEYYQEYIDKIPNMYYLIKKDYLDSHSDVTMVTQEMMNGWYNEAEQVVFGDFNPYPIFKKYKPLFRDYNLNLTWEEGL